MTLTPVTRISPTQVALPVETLLSRWPQLRRARQPPEPTGAGVPFLKRWAHDAKQFQLRDPAATPAGLIPLAGAGNCLVPFFKPGDIAWIDPQCTPAHNDFVVVLWSDDFYRRIMANAADDFRAETGRNPSGLACKRLQRVCGQWLLTSNATGGRTAAVALHGNATVCGVVTYIERRGSSTIDALPASMIRLEKVTQSDLLAVGAATDVSAVEVNSDSYSFPNPTGTQDRVFAAFDLVNPAVESYDLEISVTGGRQITTPAGLSGTTDVLSWISISNLTDSVLVSSTQDWMSAQLEDVPAGAVRSFGESTVFIVTIPGGKTFRFTPRCRVAPLVGSTGSIQLLTTAYTMRIATIKR